MKKLWERYSRKKRWWSIALDFVFILLLIAMLIPATRKPLSTFVIRHTLFSPSEADEVVFLHEGDWGMQVYSSREKETEMLRDYQGRPIFLNFWGTWCPPCIAELPSIQSLYEEYKEKVAFILVSRESPQVIDDFMEKNGYTLPSYSLKSQVPVIFETSTIPATYLISPNGQLMVRKTGAAKWNSEKFKRILDDMIQGERSEAER